MIIGIALPACSTEKLRYIIETDAGGDPDDEQSLVRFLLYVNEWDIDGIIATRPMLRGDNRGWPSSYTGLDIVRGFLTAYGKVHAVLSQHGDFPTKQYLWDRTVAGYGGDDGVNLIIKALDRADPRPIWFSNWGTDDGTPSSLRRALDKIRAERGQVAYDAAIQKIRLSSDPVFGTHNSSSFPVWVYTKLPDMDGGRWYHRFSPLTRTAGGFDIEADVRVGHGPLGALYAGGTDRPQKEGDTPQFLYLIPTGLAEPSEPMWGGWAGRYWPRQGYQYHRLDQRNTLKRWADQIRGLAGHYSSRKGYQYHWPDQRDTWMGSTNRDNTLKRWADHIQMDFKGRMDWCVKSYAQANHPPQPVVNGQGGLGAVNITAASGSTLSLNATGSLDPDGDGLSYHWVVYPEAGKYRDHEFYSNVLIANATAVNSMVHVPSDADGTTIHIILIVTDNGSTRVDYLPPFPEIQPKFSSTVT